MESTFIQKWRREALSVLPTKYQYHISMDISTAWPKSDIHTWIYPWIHIHGKPGYEVNLWLDVIARRFDW